MKTLDLLKDMSGAETALGICFSRGNMFSSVLPDRSHLIGWTGRIYFCFVEGFQETVFAVTEEPGYGRRICPLAYDVSEFIRLILACGSAAAAANTGLHGSVSSQRTDPSDPVCLKAIETSLSLTPLINPQTYVKTISQVLDCSVIRCGM